MNCRRIWFPCSFFFLIWVSLWNTVPSPWFFYFRMLGDLYSSAEPDEGSVPKVHKALQELQAVPLML